MKILIVRHGDPDYAHDFLTEKGWKEAELLSRRLSKLDVKAFYCSPLGRAQAPAKPTMEKLHRENELTILPWLREFSGSVQSPFDEKRHIPWNLAPQFWTKQKELFSYDEWLDCGFMKTGNVREVFEATCEGMDALLKEHGFTRMNNGDEKGYLFRCEENKHETIVLFCHFAIGMALISHMTGVALPLLWQGFFLPTSSVTTLITEERVPGEVFFKVMQMGDTSHLYAFDEPVSPSGLFLECLSDVENGGKVNAAQ